MLSDIERKVLRIAYNSSVGHRTLSYKEWSAKTGRREREVQVVLQKLVDLGYLEWINRDYPLVKVLQGWEVNYSLK